MSYIWPSIFMPLLTVSAPLPAGLTMTHTGHRRYGPAGIAE